MHDNPDVSRFIVRIDSFGPDGEPGHAPDASDIENILNNELPRSFLGDEFLVEVEERLA